MATNEDDVSGRERERELEPNNTLVEAKRDDVKQTYRSFKYAFSPSLHTPAKANIESHRKKYRKMRTKFDEVMRESNNNVVAEHLAEETASRLARENESVPPSLERMK